MVRQARAMAREGKLGQIRVVQVEYAQDWLAEPFEGTGNKRAGWRTDPAKAGAAGCVADIGTHAFNLAAFVTGLAAEDIIAELTNFVPGRRLDNDVGRCCATRAGRVAACGPARSRSGEENEIRLRLYGTAGGLDWCQSDANRLAYTPLGGVRQILTRNGAGAGEPNRQASRVPAGHPEGYLEGFATIYSDAADAILTARTEAAPDELSFPSVADGVAGLAFIDAAVRSSISGGTWTRLKP